MSPADLGALIDMCRSKGVRVLQHGDVRLELGPLDAEPLDEKPKVDSEMCHCGCPLYAHEKGLCTHGCDVAKCVPPGTAT